MNCQLFNFHPGNIIFQCAVPYAALRGPGGELVVDPDHQPQRREGGAGCVQNHVPIHSENAAFAQPMEGILMPLCNIQVDPAGILVDDPDSHPAEETGNRPNWE